MGLISAKTKLENPLRIIGKCDQVLKSDIQAWYRGIRQVLNRTHDFSAKTGVEKYVQSPKERARMLIIKFDKYFFSDANFVVKL